MFFILKIFLKRWNVELFSLFSLQVAYIAIYLSSMEVP